MQLIYIYNWIYQYSSTLSQVMSLDSFLTSQRKFPYLENKYRFLKFPIQTISILEMQEGKSNNLGKKGRPKKPNTHTHPFFLCEVMEGKKPHKI